MINYVPRGGYSDGVPPLLSLDFYVPFEHPYPPPLQSCPFAKSTAITSRDPCAKASHYLESVQDDVRHEIRDSMSHVIT